MGAILHSVICAPIRSPTRSSQSSDHGRGLRRDGNGDRLHQKFVTGDEIAGWR